jgi:uncharacterized membrane protein YidH (DUF202 family)
MQAKWIWASLAIVAMWAGAVLISLFAPTLVTDTAGGDHVKVPAAGIVAIVLAFGATIVLAIVGFRGEARTVERRPGEEPHAAPRDAPTGA